MQHFVANIENGRIAVVRFGAGVATRVAEGLACSRKPLENMAARLTLATEPAEHVDVYDRPIPKGFYGVEQGDLF